MSFAGPNTFRPYIAIKVLASQPNPSTSQIVVRFRNDTGGSVGFFLNGGSGLTTSLAPGASRSFNVVVNQGIQPAVTIFQSGGGGLSFSISQNGQYVFKVDRGQIKNFFDTLSSTQPSRTMWTGTFQGTTTLFKKAGNSWQEFPGGSTTPAHTFTEAGSDPNFVYLFDGTRNMHVALGLNAMFWTTANVHSGNTMFTGAWGTGE